MYPLSLTLKGFRGIRDGLGLDVLTLDLEHLASDAQLVALAGANGRGKTTLLDNLHPYLTMPSRAAVAGAGAAVGSTGRRNASSTACALACDTLGVAPGPSM